MEYSYKFRLYPNKKQKNLILRTFGCCRFVYNYYLAMRKTVYEQGGETLNYYGCSSDLTQLKQSLVWLKEVDSTALQSSLRDLDTAYQNFFRRVKQGEKPGYPKFKSKHNRHQSYKSKYVKGKGKGNIKILENAVQLPKLGKVKCRISREVKGRILSATISRTPTGKYYVALCCTDVEIEPLTCTGGVVGIDLGLRFLAYTSDGQKYENPKYLDKSLKKLAHAQRQLSRKTKGSKNWEKARLQVARIHEHIANQRLDAQHKLTTQLIRENDIICAETLQVQKMQQDNRYLSRQIGDAAWGEILRQLQYKAAWSGRTFVQVDALYPSTQLCSECGYKNTSLRKHYQESWECPQCGAIHDIDYNAAKNILNEGLRLLA